MPVDNDLGGTPERILFGKNGEHRDLTTGSVYRKLLAFAMPILVINFLQAVYNIVDMMIVGQFIGSTGMTAVSVGGQITQVTLMACMGLSNGSAAVIGQMFGAGKLKDAESVIGSLLSFLICVAVLVSVLVITLCTPLLNILHTPEDSFLPTVQYLTVCMAGSVFVYVYNALAAALRGIGESFHPMLFVMITTVENIVLDFFFVAVLRLGTAGAAAATVISQFTSMILTVVYIKRKTSLFDFSLHAFRIVPEKLKMVMRVGLPQALQFICTNLSFLFVLGLINSYGSVAAAAAGAASKLWSFGVLPGLTFMTAIITLTAQNLPAANHKRILQGMRFGMGISLAFAFIMLALCELAPEGMYRLFTQEPEVAEIGTSYLRIHCLCYPIEVTMFCLFGVLTGSGYTTVTMICAIISSFGVRYIAAIFLSTHTPLGFCGIALGKRGTDHAKAALRDDALVGEDNFKSRLVHGV